MPDRYRCRVEDTQVRSDRRDDLEDLVWTLFERRNHDYVAGREKEWLRVELVQSLREESRVYREELSTKTEGPLPFALGYFKVRGDMLALVSDEIPANVGPETFVRFLSEFLEPGARFWFAAEEGTEGWEVRGVDDIVALSSEEETPQAAPADSSGASN